MADPQILYIVSAVVVLALVAWVIVVIARAPALPDARKNPETVTAPASPAPAPSPPPPTADSPKAVAPDPMPDPTPAAKSDPPQAQDVVEAEIPSRSSKLDAHLEIQDEDTARGRPDKG